MSAKNKALTATIVLASLSGRVDAQTASKDTIPPQTTQQNTALEDKYLVAFENIYSNALYVKYRTDAAIKSDAPTPPEMMKKIENDAKKYALNIRDLKRNKAAKEDVRATHFKQMGGVTVSSDGRSYSYPYERDGEKRKVVCDLVGSATSFVELEKEEREFDQFFNVQKSLMDKQQR